MSASRYYDIYSSQRDSMIYRYGLLHNFTLEILGCLIYCISLSYNNAIRI